MVLIVESYRGTIIQIDNTTLFVKKCRYAADLDKIFKISLAKTIFFTKVFVYLQCQKFRNHGKTYR